VGLMGPKSPERLLGSLLLCLVIGWAARPVHARWPAADVLQDAAYHQKFAYRDEVVFRKLNATLETKNGPMPALDRTVYRVIEVDETRHRLRLESSDDYALGWTEAKQVVKFDDAADLFTREIQSRPKDAEAFVMRGRIQLERKSLDDAEEDFDRAIQFDPRRGIFFVYRAMVRIYRGQLDEALADCNEAVQLDPSESWAHAVRATASLLRNDYPQADQDLDDLIRIDGEKPLDWSARFRDWLHERRYDRFGPANRIEPVPVDDKTVIAHLWRADIAVRKADAPRAVTEYGEALKLDSNNALIYALRARAWAIKHERNRESADFARAIELDPSNIEYRLARGASWSAQGRHELAIADFDEVIRLAPTNTAGYLYRGNEQRKHLKLDVAVDDYNRAIQVDPRCSQAYLNRGLVWKQRRDFEHAVQEFQRLLEWDKNNVDGHRTLARLLATCNDEDVRDGHRAVQEAKAACELTNWQDPDCLDTLAAAQAEAGDFDGAVASQAKAIRLLKYSNAPSALQRSLSFGGRRGVGFQDRLAFYKSKKPCRE
jgi:tetratricopeptide (TPR) repeat protein